MQPHQRTQSTYTRLRLLRVTRRQPKVPLLRISYILIRTVPCKVQFHWTPTEGGGFLLCGGNIPAIDLRFLLLMAGDVESNPGPVVSSPVSNPGAGESNPGPECISCGLPTLQEPLSCAAESCDKVAHSQRVCSGRRGKGNDVWRCPEHREEVARPCDQCGNGCERKKPGDRGPRRCVVAGCDKVCHRGKKCSKLSRYDKYLDWTCRAHRGSPERSSLMSQEGAEGRQQEAPRQSVKCGGCRTLDGKKKTIAKHIVPIVCNRCGASFHGGCTDLPRLVIERIREDPDCPDALGWSCSQCQKKIVQQDTVTASIFISVKMRTYALSISTSVMASLVLTLVRTVALEIQKTKKVFALVTAMNNPKLHAPAV